MSKSNKQSPERPQNQQKSFEFNGSMGSPSVSTTVIPFPQRSTALGFNADLNEQARFAEKLLARAKLIDWD